MKKILLILLMFTTIFSVLSFGNSSETLAETNYPKGIKNITAVTESTGLGEKVTAVILEINGVVNNEKLTNDLFTVENRVVEKIYATNKKEKSSKGKNGKYIVVELSTKDSVATDRTKDFSGNAIKVNLIQNKSIPLQMGDFMKWKIMET